MCIVNQQKEEYVVRELYAEWCEEAIAAWLPPDWDSNRGTKWIEVACLEGDVKDILLQANLKHFEK